MKEANDRNNVEGDLSYPGTLLSHSRERLTGEAMSDAWFLALVMFNRPTRASGSDVTMTETLLYNGWSGETYSHSPSRSSFHETNAWVEIGASR